MDKRTVGAVAIAAILLLIAVIVALYQRRELPTTSEVSYATTTINNFNITTSTNPPQTTTVRPLYIIGAWEDKLALFIPPDTSPNQVFDVFLPSLPEEEQQRLYDGIEVFDEQSLASLLEDYTS